MKCWALETSNLDNVKRGRCGSAHAFSRHLADTCHASCLARLACFEARFPAGVYHVVDVGAKFRSMINLLEKALTPKFTSIYPPYPFEKSDPAGPRNLANWQQCYKNIRQICSTFHNDCVTRRQPYDVN